MTSGRDGKTCLKVGADELRLEKHRRLPLEHPCAQLEDVVDHIRIVWDRLLQEGKRDGRHPSERLAKDGQELRVVSVASDAYVEHVQEARVLLLLEPARDLW